jgi:hypothetical protein
VLAEGVSDWIRRLDFEFPADGGVFDWNIIAKLWPTWHRIQWVQGVLFPGLRLSEREYDLIVPRFGLCGAPAPIHNLACDWALHASGLTNMAPRVSVQFMHFKTD